MKKHPRLRNRRNIQWLLTALIVLIAAGLWPIWWRTDQPDSQFNKHLYSVNAPSSLWVVVNKGRQLPSNYVPADLLTPAVPLRLAASDSEMQLRPDAATALEQLFTTADRQNIHLMLASGYRSYSWQASVHNYFVSSQGQAEADATSARPGHSEHQTGLAADIEPASRHCEIEICFADTPEGRWLATNAHEYGFIIRYQKNQQNLTGYAYEPWHIRFMGKDLASQIYNSGQTPEQFFSLPIVINYPSASYRLEAGH